MTLAIISPAFEGPDRALLYLESAKRVGLRPILYGQGSTWNGWAEAKGNRLLSVMRSAVSCGASHLMYTDAYDTFWLAGMPDIAHAYFQYDCPNLLMSCEKDAFPAGDWPSEDGKYINSGGFMGEAETVIKSLEAVQRAYVGETANDQEWWHRGWADGIVEPRLDVDSWLWQTMSGGVSLDLNDPDWTPCQVHFNGRLPGIEELYEKVWGEK